MPLYAYYKTPLRPESGNAVSSSVSVDLTTRTFTATAIGTPDDNPTDPLKLTDAQAANGAQFFFYSANGYVEAKYSVESTDPACTGRNLLFAGKRMPADPSDPSVPL